MKYFLVQYVFKASALWADAFYKSKCSCVCPCVRLFTFEVPFKCLCAPTCQSRMSKNFKDSESFVKSNGKKWSQIWTFLFGSGLKSPRKKSLCFCLFCRKKTCWEPSFPMDERPLVEGYIANFDIFISRRFWTFAFWMIFSVKKKEGFLAILGPPYRGIGATILIGWEMLCLPYAGFFMSFFPEWSVPPKYIFFFAIFFIWKKWRRKNVFFRIRNDKIG